MPYTTADARKHKSTATSSVQEKWVRIANATQRQCLAAGGTEASCGIRAIRQANSKCSGKRPRMSLTDLESGIATARAEVVKLHARHAQSSHGRRKGGGMGGGAGVEGLVGEAMEMGAPYKQVTTKIYNNLTPSDRAAAPSLHKAGYHAIQSGSGGSRWRGKNGADIGSSSRGGKTKIFSEGSSAGGKVKGGRARKIHKTYAEAIKARK